MKTTSSYKVKIVNVNRSLDNTINIYRDALSFIVNVIDENWINISLLSTSKEKYNYVENLIHNTVNNLALYDFDKISFTWSIHINYYSISCCIHNE